MREARARSGQGTTQLAVSILCGDSRSLRFSPMSAIPALQQDEIRPSPLPERGIDRVKLNQIHLEVDRSFIERFVQRRARRRSEPSARSRSEKRLMCRPVAREPRAQTVLSGMCSLGLRQNGRPLALGDLGPRSKCSLGAGVIVIPFRLSLLARSWS